MTGGLPRWLEQLLPAIGARQRAKALGPALLNWLQTHRYQWRSALVADSSALGFTLADALVSGGVAVIRRNSGEDATLVMAGLGRVRMGRPQAGSFLHYLAYESGRPSDHDLLFVDVSGGGDWPRLLRGRLRAGQTVGFRLPAGTAPLWLADWSQPTFAADSVHFFKELPSAWLAPGSGQKSAGLPESNSCWPRISVVTVSFNQAMYLEECLRSVLSQDYPNLEYIVVDGGSQDGSQKILDRYRSHLAALVIEPDDGQADGLNKGFALATGDILTWVNSDDLIEQGALRRVALAYQAYDTDLVAGGCRHVWKTREHVIVNHHNQLPLGECVQLPLDRLLAFDECWQKGEFFFQPEVFFNRRAWNAAGGRVRTDLFYVLDYDLWIRMARAGVTIVHIPDFLAVSRGHELQKTTPDLPFVPEARRLIAEYEIKTRQ